MARFLQGDQKDQKCIAWLERTENKDQLRRKLHGSRYLVKRYFIAPLTILGIVLYRGALYKMSGLWIRSLFSSTASIINDSEKVIPFEEAPTIPVSELKYTINIAVSVVTDFLRQMNLLI